MNSEIMSNPNFSKDTEQTKEPADTYSETAEILTPPTAGEVAADWWVEKLQNPTFDLGDGSECATILATTIRKRRPSQLTPETLDSFKHVLADKINQHLADQGHHLKIGVDYHPDSILRECAEESGLIVDELEWSPKTQMLIETNQVSVFAGYGAEEKVIWEQSSDESELQTQFSEDNETFTPPTAGEEDGSMTIIDSKDWEKYKADNDDPYGQSIIEYAERWAGLMEKQINEGYDLASIANETSHQANTDRLSYFTFSVAANALIKHWKYGEQLDEWYQSQYPN